jgi:hypothetical protein
MLWDEEHRRRHLQLLEAVGMAQAAREPLDLGGLASALGVFRRDGPHGSRSARRDRALPARARGRAAADSAHRRPPVPDRRGNVDHDVLSFLAHVIDDLNARKALLTAGTILVDECRAAWLDGDPVDHARDLVPPAFATAVDERLALDLFAAAVALVAGLSDGAPAGCVAEEIISVGLMEEARERSPFGQL